MHRETESLEFPVDDFHREVIEIILRGSFAGRSSAISAVRHLNLAWHLRSTDAQMAMLRSITAKEEAATALFRVLQDRRYPDHSKLRPRNHLHKNAILPFVEVVARVWELRGGLVPSWALVIEDAETSRARLRLVFDIETAGGDVSYVKPMPPLNFEFSRWSPVAATLVREDFQDGVDAVISDQRVKEIIEYLSVCANDRNLLLYASEHNPAAMPNNIAEQLTDHQWAVLLILKLYVMIAPYPQHQLFVRQALAAFIRMITRVTNEPQPVTTA